MKVVSISSPTISREGFSEILRRNDSPAAPDADACFDVICSYGVDPAFALAIFCHESTFGKKGQAVKTLNWGNLRSGEFADRNTYTPDGKFEWAWYWGADAWIRSAKDCARLLKKYGEGKMTFEPCKVHAKHDEPAEIFYHWAPTGDGGNKPSAYAQAVIDLVTEWQAEFPVAPPEPTDGEKIAYLGAAVEDLQKQLAEQRAYFGQAVEDLDKRIKVLEEECERRH